MRHPKLPDETLKLSEKGWLVAANAIILTALMVWLQGWRDTLRYYSDKDMPTLTAEVSLVFVSLMIVTCLISVFYIWKYEKQELSYGLILFVLFCIVIAVVVNMVTIIYKGFIRVPQTPVFGDWEPTCILRYVIFGVISIIALFYLYILLRRPQWLSNVGFFITRLW